MTTYLRCIRARRGEPGPECRELSRGYLQCRMDNGLMAVDEMRNLGFVDKDKEREEGIGGGRVGAGAVATATLGQAQKG